MPKALPIITVSPTPPPIHTHPPSTSPCHCPFLCMRSLIPPQRGDLNQSTHLTIHTRRDWGPTLWWRSGDQQTYESLFVEGDVLNPMWNSSQQAPEKSSKPSGLTATPGAVALRPHSPSMEAKMKSEQGSTMLEELRSQLRELRATVELMKSQHK